MDRAKADLALRVMEAAYPYRSIAGAFSPPNSSIEIRAAECVLAALYLAGAPRGIEVPPRNWTCVLRWMRAEGALLGSASRLLRRRGLREEALALETPGLFDWAERRVMAGVVTTAASPDYPAGWARKLGASAPAAVWKRGDMPPGHFLAVVGSRAVGHREKSFSREVAAEAVRLGYSVVSGAAAGCDQAAAAGAINEGRKPINDIEKTPLVEILPCGMALRRERFGGCVLSPFAPHEEFSGPNAMRRNTLIYAMADATIVVQSRFGEGGTWRGAIEANRRKLCRLIVREDAKDRAANALIGLGATPLEAPRDLQIVLQALEPQGDLSL